MKELRALTIAGFDPTGGAGLLADIQTMSLFNQSAIGVCTANTIQTSKQFISPNWVDDKIVLDQLKLMISSYDITYAKVGLISSFKLLAEVLNLLSQEKIKVIWDPVLASSSGYVFHNKIDEVEPLLEKVYLITPNWQEVKILAKNQDSEKGAQYLSQYTNVLLKGGHNEEQLGTDYLYTKDQQKIRIPAQQIFEEVRHGSGCVLSAAIVAHLHKFSLLEACQNAKCKAPLSAKDSN